MAKKTQKPISKMTAEEFFAHQKAGYEKRVPGAKVLYVPGISVVEEAEPAVPAEDATPDVDAAETEDQTEKEGEN
jgi:hypothetical protein